MIMVLRSSDGRGRVFWEVALAILLSSMLFESIFMSTLLALPILLLRGRLSEGKICFLLVFEMAVVVLMTLAESSFKIEDKIDLALLFLNLVAPASMLCSGAVWMKTEKKGAVERIYLSSLPSFFILLVVALYIRQDMALQVGLTEHFLNVFGLMLEGFFHINDSVLVGNISSVLLSLSLMLIFPFIVSSICVTGFIYETVLHSKESDWEEKMGLLDVDSRFIWAFLAFWAVAIYSSFLSSFPKFLGYVVFNVALALTIAYMVQGFSVLVYLLRKFGFKIRAFPLFLVLFFIFMIVPWVNVLVFSIILVLGLAENFVELRR